MVRGGTLKASSPPNVLKVMKPLTVSLTSMPFFLLLAATLPSGITPPTCGVFELPSNCIPFPPLATVVVLSMPIPKKFAWTTVLSEFVTRKPDSSCYRSSRCSRQNGLSVTVQPRNTVAVRSR